MFNPRNNDLFVSDTYPNLLGFQKIIHLLHEKKKLFGKNIYIAHTEFKGIVRCDLHPRWSNNGKKFL